MAQIVYRCEVCSSEILASVPRNAPNVCLICRLSADEALSEAAQPHVSVRPAMLYCLRKGRAASRAINALLALR